MDGGPEVRPMVMTSAVQTAPLVYLARARVPANEADVAHCCSPWVCTHVPGVASIGTSTPSVAPEQEDVGRSRRRYTRCRLSTLSETSHLVPSTVIDVKRPDGTLCRHDVRDQAAPACSAKEKVWARLERAAPRAPPQHAAVTAPSQASAMFAGRGSNSNILRRAYHMSLD